MAAASFRLAGARPDSRTGGASLRVFHGLLLLCGFLSALVGPTQAAEPVDDLPLATACSRLHRSVLETFVAARRQNMVFSPVSVLRVLRSLQAGASGETREEIRALLDTEHAHLEIPNLSRKLSDKATEIIIQAADRIYVDESVEDPVFDKYCQRVQSLYHVTTDVLDFQGDLERAAKVINRFVSHTTFGLIREVVTPDDFSSNTKLAAVNAMYLKAPWSCAFDPYGERAFRGYDREGRPVDQLCQFMMKEVPSLYLEYLTGPVKAVRLPYKHEDLAMYIFMPQNIDEFEADEDFPLVVNRLVDAMHADLFRRRMAQPERPGHVEVYLPKFTMLADNNNFNVAEVLHSLGISHLFGDADLSRMTRNPDVSVSTFKHATHISVDEDGTIAAAATVACVADSGAMMISSRLVFDGPFVFQIRYQPDHERARPGSAASDMVLFSGHLASCAAGQGRDD